MLYSGDEIKIIFIFIDRVKDMLSIKPLKFKKCVIFYLISSAIIHQFVDGKKLSIFSQIGVFMESANFKLFFSRGRSFKRYIRLMPYKIYDKIYDKG